MNARYRPAAVNPEDQFWSLVALTASSASDPKRQYLALLAQYQATVPNATEARLEAARLKLQRLLGMVG